MRKFKRYKYFEPAAGGLHHHGGLLRFLRLAGAGPQRTTAAEDTRECNTKRTAVAIAGLHDAPRYRTAALARGVRMTGYRTSRRAYLTCLACSLVHAQDLQVYPELDANFKLNSVVRLNFQAKGDREAGDPLQSQVGPGILIYLKPLIRLRHVTAFDLDDTKSRFLVLEGGYRYLSAPNTPTDNRMIVAYTANYPLKGDFLISDRNRADLDWKNDNFTWRYRNKFTLQRTLSVVSWHFIPYVACEPYYESQYSKVSTTALYAGSLFPVGKHVQFDTYYETENNTGKRPNKQDVGVGFALRLYFAREKQ